MIVFTQAEVAKDLISTTDATIIGILLAGIVLLGVWIVRQDKKIEKRDLYIREQDKATLQILGELTEHIKERTEHQKLQIEKVEKVGESVSAIKTNCDQILKIVENKLLNMKQ